ncbi:MAG: hypothetical protein LC104_01635 [Bacteroidales bacterium]|nr:hypothetical protein [Bacteroidales bacterium]
MNGDNHENGRKANGRRKPVADHVPRRRSRLPVHADVRLDDSLPANENHPLAQSSPEAREAGRLRLIAGILARMARTSVKPKG